MRENKNVAMTPCGGFLVQVLVLPRASCYCGKMMGTRPETSKSRPLTLLVVPGLTVFVSSACIMILELVAGRLIARHLGSSLYTWTSVIGVVLTGITVGNYLGGRLADRFDCRRSLAVLFWLSACACVQIVVMENLVGQWRWLWLLNWPAHVFMHVMLVFFLPSALLGMISPFVAKMALDRGLPTGRTVGDIYAFSAAGSIAGTFLAGFYLITALGTVTIIWVVGGLLALLGLVFGPGIRLIRLGSGLLVLMAAAAFVPYPAVEQAGRRLALKKPAEPEVIYERETPYCRVRVKQLSQQPDHRVFMQDKLVHSKINMDDPLNLQYAYTRLYAAFTEAIHPRDEPISALAIGGGGYVLPRYLEQRYSQARIDVVEIDPGVTQAAMDAFGLPADTSINTISMDARNYIDQLLIDSTPDGPAVKYDLIYEDALNDYAIPFQLVTREFNEKIARILNDDGIYMIELIDTYQSGLFLGGVVNTLGKTFSSVDVITDYDPPTPARRTFIVLASNGRIDVAQVVSDIDCDFQIWHLNALELDGLVEKSGRIVLTDMYAPVESLLAPVVCQNAYSTLAEDYIERGKRLKLQGRWQESIAFFNRAAETDPLAKVEALNEIAMIRAGRGDFRSAVANLEAAIALVEGDGGRSCEADVYLNMGLVTRQTKGVEQARPYFKKAIEGFREAVRRGDPAPELLTRMGNALAESGELVEASEVLGRAVTMNPADPANYSYLTTCLRLQGRWQEAKEVLVRGIGVMADEDRPKDRADLEQMLRSLEKQMVVSEPGNSPR